MKLDIKAVIFDLDGTILDTRPVYRQATKEMFPNLSEEESLAFGLKIGQEIEKYGLKSVKSLSEKDLNTWLTLWYKNQETFSCVFEDFYSLIKTLKNKSLLTAINTNRPQKSLEVRAQLKNYSLENSFDLIMTASEAGKRKPDPVGLLKICDYFNLPVSHILFVGDSNADILAGKNANINVIALTTGVFQKKELIPLDPFLIFDSLQEVENYIKLKI